MSVSRFSGVIFGGPLVAYVLMALSATNNCLKTHSGHVLICIFASDPDSKLFE